MQLQDIVQFRSDRLFNGAVNIDWFHSDNQTFCEQAAEAFVFHGPDYHGVQQQDVGVSHGHRLRDTAGFAASILRRCYGQEDTPFTLAIAGYGTGKSHLALTLAKLLSDPDSQISRNIRQAILKADRPTGEEINAILHENRKPCLVVAINGIGSFDLVSEFTRQIMLQLKQHQLSTRSVENLRPRFSHAAKLIDLSSANLEIIQQIRDACGGKDIDTVLQDLTEQNEITYEKVQQIFADIGMPIRAIGGESLKELIGLVCQEYCGSDHPFSRLVVLFDEFGKYTEFATMRSQIAGSGVLQELSEGIQSKSDAACFVGFIQFEMNAYVQRVAPEYRNEIIRYITRYELADKSYLSTNLETLIAHLFEKKDPEFLDNCFDSSASMKESQEMMGQLNQYFPKSQTYRLWKTSDLFHKVIRKGCWPLSPFSLWLLFHLTSSGKLQERSAFSLLADVFNQKGSARVDQDGNWSLSPTDIWTPALEQDLFTAEESGNQGALVHAYLSVRERYASKIVGEIDVILKGVVLAAKMGIKIDSREQALNAIGFLTGLNESTTRDYVGYLQNDLNVLEWDEAFKQFDILGDSVPRSQFISFLRHRVAAGFDEDAKARLFASKAREWCDLLGDLDCDFSENNRISTREWRYASKTTCMELLETQVGFAADQWSRAVGVDEPRGTIIYCYLDRNRDPERAAADAKIMLKRVAKEKNTAVIPVIIVLLYDDTGNLGQYLAEYEILGDSLTAEDRSRFKNLIDLHREKSAKMIRDRIDELIKQRRYITGMQNDIGAKRLGGFGSELLAGIYNKPVAFPFDGFTTARGNAANTCQELMMLMFQGKLDYDVVQSKKPSEQNRIRSVLMESWDIFDKNGKIARRPKQDVVRSIINIWDQKLNATDKHMIVGHALREICLPPYGANIASAGLLFAIFVSARIEDLTLVVGGQQFDPGTWFQQNAFKGKFLGLDQLDHAEIMRLGEEAEEWNILVDEWEQTEEYRSHLDFYNRYYQLNKRIPVPIRIQYRVEKLVEQAKLAEKKLQDNEKKQNIEWKKIENRHDLSKVVWGAAELEKLCVSMENEASFWQSNQIEQIRNPLVRVKQDIIQQFDAWLVLQTPPNDKPETIGDFKHRMNILLAGNLKTLYLDDLAQQLTDHTKKMIANAETVADAKVLIRAVKLWMDENADAFRIIKIARLRGLSATGKDYSNKLRGLAERLKNLSHRINLPEISETRVKLAEFMDKIKSTENTIGSKAKKIWSNTIKSPDDIQLNQSLVTEIVSAYEGETSDLADFLLMQQCLESYQRGYTALRDENLNPDEFETRYQALLQQAKDQFDDEEPPWLPDDVYSIFKKLLTGERELRSREWITALENKLVGLADMTSTEANCLNNETLRPPPCLTSAHSAKLITIRKKIDKHLNSLLVDWLFDKYQELPKPSRKRFLDKIQKAS